MGEVRVGASAEMAAKCALLTFARRAVGPLSADSGRHGHPRLDELRAWSTGASLVKSISSRSNRVFGMSAAHDLDGLIRFILRDEVWAERPAELLDEHLGPALEEFDVDFEELGDLLGQSWPMILWGCAFEDLLGRRYGAGGDNVADLYLKRRGWKEPALTRAYIEGLRDAPVSLYEVSEIRPGQSMQLRDLLTEVGPVTVQEKSATRSLKPWDRVAVRVVA